MSKPVDPDDSLGRPLRMRVCGHCGGSGQVKDPYWLRPADGHLHLIQEGSGQIRMHVVASAFIFEATREAHEIATQRQIAVVFDFLGRRVIVRPEDQPDEVARQWWKDFYGQTYEESRAQR